MKPVAFYGWLFITALASYALGNMGIKGADSGALRTAHWTLIGFFIFFTVLMFFVARKTIQSSNPYLFTRVFMVSVFFKIMLLSMLVFGMVKTMALIPRQLAMPLGVSYLLFTVFETWVLMKLSKTK